MLREKLEVVREHGLVGSTRVFHRVVSAMYSLRNAAVHRHEVSISELRRLILGGQDLA